MRRRRTSHVALLGAVGILLFAGCLLVDPLDDLSRAQRDFGSRIPADTSNDDGYDGGSFYVDGKDDASTGCDWSKPFDSPKAIPALSGPGAQGGPSLSPDELTAYFALSPEGASTHDLYVATRKSLDDDFDTPLLLSSVSGPSDEKDPMIAADGLSLLFNREGTLMIATRLVTTEPFGTPKSLTNFDSTALAGVSPWLSQNDTFFFASNVNGSFDLFRATLVAGIATFTTSIDSINSTAFDVSPVPSPDERTLLFSSNRSGGQGGIDIWVATHESSTEAFGPARNLTEVNSDADDFVTWISPDGCRLYLGSSRLGTFDAFVATRL